jgi:hypothetical protein
MDLPSLRRTVAVVAMSKAAYDARYVFSEELKKNLSMTELMRMGSAAHTHKFCHAQILLEFLREHITRVVRSLAHGHDGHRAS